MTRREELKKTPVPENQGNKAGHRRSPKIGGYTLLTSKPQLQKKHPYGALNKWAKSMIPNLEHHILLMTHVGRCFKNINLSSSLSCPGTCIKLLWEIQHFRSRSSYILTAVAKTGSMVLSNGSHDDVQLQWRGSMALGSSFCKSITSLPFHGSRYPLSRCGLLPSSSASFSPQRLHLFKLQQITTPFSPSQNNLITFGS